MSILLDYVLSGFQRRPHVGKDTPLEGNSGHGRKIAYKKASPRAKCRGIAISSGRQSPLTYHYLILKTFDIKFQPPEPSMLWSSLSIFGLALNAGQAFAAAK